MSPEDYQQIKDLFAEVSRLDAGRRGAFLDARSPTPSVRREVEALLAYDGEPDDHLKTPALGIGPTRLRRLAEQDRPSEPPPERLGQYRIVRALGEGGMGVVYLAEQERPRRFVALKVIRRGLATPSLVRRFEHEAELLGRLRHPGIASVLEAGVASTPTGPVPFLAMELVEGPTLTEYARQAALSTEARVQLMVKACAAVHHAHQRGVIHRDLKPGNILVDLSSGHPEPKILDFGVARAVDKDHGVTSVQTAGGQLIGTLAYMSPEQVSGDVRDVDVRSDVYALGVVLYQLLAGRLPFDLSSKSIPEAARIIRDDSPQRLTGIDRTLAGELQVIVAKAMDKDRARRYQSAAELSSDLERFLRGEPIAARQDSALYVIRKYIRRHKVLSTLATALVLSVVFFAVFAAWQAGEQSRLAGAERSAKGRAQLALADAERLRTIAEERSNRLQESLYFSAIGHAMASYLGGDVEKLKRALESCPPERRGWEWRYLERLGDESAATWELQRGAGTIVRFAHAGDRVAFSVGPAVIRVGDTASGADLDRFDFPAGSQGPAFSPSGRILVVGGAGSITLHGPGPGDQRRIALPTQAPLLPIVFSPDERVLFGLGPRGQPFALDLISERHTWFDNNDTVSSAAWSPDGARVATGGRDGRVRVRDPASGRILADLGSHDGQVRWVAFSPDSTRLVTAGNDASVRVWDAAGAAAPIVLRPHANKVWCAIWTPDGRYVVSGGTDSVICVTDPADARVIRSLHGHQSTVHALAFDSATGDLLSGSFDSTIRRWHAITEPRDPIAVIDRASTAAALSPDTHTVIMARQGSTLVALDALSLRVRAETPWGDFANHIRFSPDGSELVAVGEGGLVEFRDASTLALRVAFRSPEGRAIDAAFEPSGARLALVSSLSRVTIHDVASGARLEDLPEEPRACTRVLWTDSAIYTGNMDGVVRAYDPRTRELLASYEGLVPYVTGLLVPPGSDDRLLGCDSAGSIRVWDRATGAVVVTLSGHMGEVRGAAFSPDGSRLVTGGWDNTVRLWDWRAGQELLTLRGHFGAVFLAGFTADGSRLITGAGDGVVRAWIAGPPSAPQNGQTSSP